MRVTLRLPGSEPVVRDIRGGLWAEPEGLSEGQFGADMFALPGLVDGHSHLAAEELDYQPGDLDEAIGRAREALSQGVTLVFDKGWSDDTTIRLIDRLPAEQRPEIQAAARIIAVLEGYWPGFAHEVEPDGLVEVVEAEARRGAGWVKLIGDWPRRGRGPVANFTTGQLRQVVEAAGRHGAQVAIHTMAREVPSQAVAAGVHSIEHGLFLTRDDVAVLGARRGMWVPTILRVEATIAQLGPESSGGRLLGAGLENVRELLPHAVESGVVVLAGTDLVGSPGNVVAEARRLLENGLSAAEVVDAVSTAGFAVAGRPDPFAIGSPADAVFYSADPTQEIGVLAHPSRVIRLGSPV